MPTMPAGISTVTVTGRYIHPDGSPLTGTVTFMAPSLLSLSGADTIATGSAKFTLSNGMFQAVLIATDNPGMQPTGWAYQVVEQFDGVAGRSYWITLPATAAVVDLADLAPADPARGNYILVPGPEGAAGANGNTILSGHGAPPSDAGVDGDYWMDQDATTLYGPKASGTWPGTGVALVGGGGLVSSVNGLQGAVVLTAGTLGALAASANLSDVADQAQARANLGLGAAATRGVGTSSDTVAAGNDARFSDSRTPTAHASTHGSGGSDPVTPAAIGALPTTGGTVTGALAINKFGAPAGYPIGMTAAAVESLSLPSSYSGGDDNGTGTDSTGRINLYSYQRANVGSFGENIRNFVMRADAKTMQAFYIPVQTSDKTGGYDPTTRDPKTTGVAWKPVVWQGAHYEANSHSNIHGHWELEIADESGALQGRLEIPFIDQSKGGGYGATSGQLDGAKIGIAYTNIRTNLADLSVRAQTINAGDYTGNGNTALRIGGNNTVPKQMLLSISSDMAASGRRWAVEANTDNEAGSNAGTNFRIVRYDDTGAAIGTALFIQRSDGQITNGAAGAKGSRWAAVWATAGQHGFSAQPSAAIASGAAFDAQMNAVTERALQTTVTGDANRRMVMFTDGKVEWGDGTNARDANLYRAAAGRLKTDTAFHVGTTLGVGALPSSTDAVTVNLGTDANGVSIVNTNATGNVNGPLYRGESKTANSLLYTARVTGDASSRYVSRVDGQMTWGDGTSARDTNLYRAAASTLKTDNSLHVGADLRHLGSNLSFYGASAAAKPTVTGSRGGNAALASLLTSLATLGLITDSTTA